MTSPFDLKLYVEDGKLKYVVYGTWQGEPINEDGTISELKEGYNTGDFSNLTLKLAGGSIRWIVKNYKFNIDGIYLDQNLLGILCDFNDGHNKVNIYKNSAGEWWVVYYNPEKEQEDSYTFVSGKNAPSNENPKSSCSLMFKSRKSKSKSSKSKRSKSKKSSKRRSKVVKKVVKKGLKKGLKKK
jgi:hypothetical protein